MTTGPSAAEPVDGQGPHESSTPQDGSAPAGPSESVTASESASLSAPSGPSESVTPADWGMTSASPGELPGSQPSLAADETPSELPTTGLASVDAALRPLEALDELPVAEHPEVVERVHADLQEALADVATLERVVDGAEGR